MSKTPKNYELPQNAIAIIGMSGRFPGAKDLPTFWENQRQGRDTISRFGDEELEDTFGPEIRNQPNFVKARPILDDVDQFDAGFFSMYPREAAITDPQHRLMLECAWEALEDGGVDPAKFEGSIGMFAGCTYNSYFLKHVLGTTEAIEEFTSSMQLGDYARYVGATPDTLATRVAFKLNLRGPPSTCNRAARPHCWRLRKRCRACCCSRATWRLRAACRSRSRRSAAISTPRAAWPPSMAACARSMPTPLARSSATARALCC